MPEINLSDSRGRDAVVSAESVTIPLNVRWIDDSGSQIESRKVLRATWDHDIQVLVEKHGGTLDEPTEKKDAKDAKKAKAVVKSAAPNASPDDVLVEAAGAVVVAHRLLGVTG